MGAHQEALTADFAANRRAASRVEVLFSLHARLVQDEGLILASPID